METIIANNVVDLWEAWVDASEGLKLYVVGTIRTGRSKTKPALLKKKVSGASPSHLMLEVLPCLQQDEGRETEVAYAEPVFALHQYHQISICAGEDVIVHIDDIDVLY